LGILSKGGKISLLAAIPTRGQNEVATNGNISGKKKPQIFFKAFNEIEVQCKTVQTGKMLES